MHGRKINIEISEDDLKRTLLAIQNSLYEEKTASRPHRYAIARLRNIGKRLNWYYGLLTGNEIKLE